MRLAAFDPRTRTLSGLAAINARQRYLNALGCACANQQKLSRLGNAMRLRGLGRLRGFGRLGQGDEEYAPVTPIDTTMYDDTGTLVAPTDTSDISSPYSTLLPGYSMPQPSAATLTPSTYDPSTGLIAPTSLSNQQIVAQQAYGTTNLTSLTPVQQSALATAVPSNSTSLSAAQFASAIQSATGLVAGAVAPTTAAAGTILGIPSTYFVYGGIALLGVMLLGSVGKKR